MRTLGLSCLLLQVASLGVAEDPGGAAPVATLCSPQGLCYSLHSEARDYRQAEAACAPLGRLAPMKDEEEKRSILGLMEEGGTDLDKAWIGLSKPPAQCVVKDRPLRGFQWAPGDEASEVALWAASPQPTCTSARCVALQRPEGATDWHWKEYLCSKRYSYICRHDHQGVCSSLDLYHGKLVYQQTFLAARPPVFSPPGTKATAMCHSGDRNVTVTCQWHAGGYQWVSTEGLHPICSCPPGYEPTGRGHCADTDECQRAPCGGRPCHNTQGGFTCLDGAPMVTTGGLPAADETTPVPDNRLEHGGTHEAMVPRRDGETATPRPRAEPRPTAPDRPLTPGPGPSADGGPEPTLAASEASSFFQVLVPAILAAVTLGILALFLVAIYKMCCRRRGEEAKTREMVPTAEGTDPEGHHMPSVAHPEENGL